MQVEVTPIQAMGMTLSQEDILFIAQSVHEANHAWCIRMGDESQTCWAEAPEWQRSSAIQGVIFQLNRITLPSDPSASHASWSLAKINDGWVYGEVKDAEAKTHPCLVPFDQLPKEQQFKDVLFESLCRELFMCLYNKRVNA